MVSDEPSRRLPITQCLPQTSHPSRRPGEQRSRKRQETVNLPLNQNRGRRLSLGEFAVKIVEQPRRSQTEFLSPAR